MGGEGSEPSFGNHPCAQCAVPIGDNDDCVECFGRCKLSIHVQCLPGATNEDLIVLRKVKNAVFVCDACLSLAEFDDMHSEKRLDEIAIKLDSLASVVEGFKNVEHVVRKAVADELMRLNKQDACAAPSPGIPSFASVLQASSGGKNRTKRKVSNHDHSDSVQIMESSKATATIYEEGGLLRSGMRRRIEHKKSERSPVTLPVPVKFPDPISPLRKSNAVNKIEQTVLFKPKREQSAEVTKADICASLDPAEFSVKDVRLRENGDVTVRCETSDHAVKLASAASNILKENYCVESQKPLKPRVKIIGFSKDIGEEELISKLRKQNPGTDNLDLKLIRMQKKESQKSNHMSVILETDARGFDDLIKRQRVNIGWERCRVVEATDVFRCFNCSEYGHKAASCKNPSCCPRCAGDHQVNECVADYLKCNNCHVMNTKRSSPYDQLLEVNHASWSTDCPIFAKRLKSARQRVDFST